MKLTPPENIVCPKCGNRTLGIEIYRHEGGRCGFVNLAREDERAKKMHQHAFCRCLHDWIV